ncbi:hypothetical protein Tco_0624541 [Tanacetum coccineum]|uniref:Uncharacterized protein n=1 Tax=Tanacetum coccineum TaxID=301880 RepID=A0ABQ4WED5_9ASTR
MGEGSANPTYPHHTPTFIQPSTSQPQKIQKPRKPKRKDTQIAQSSGPTEHVVDEAVYKELNDKSSSLRTTSSGGPWRQETMEDTIAQTRFENVSKHSNDPLLAKGNTLQSGKDSLKLMELCTNLQTRVLDLEKIKTTQAEEIVTRVESSGDEESLGKDASKQGRINAIDADKDVTLINDKDDVDMFDVNTLTGDEVLAEQEVATKDVNLTVDEVTLAEALAALKSVKPKVKANVVEEPSVPVSAASTKEKVQDKGKGIMVEPEKPLKKKDQISFDEQEAIRLQVEFDEDERLAKVDADYQLAQRLKEESTLHKRAEEKSNKPPTKTQQKKTMITYLKNMEGWKHKDLKSKDFDSIKELFDKAFKRVNMFVDYRTDIVESSSNRTGDELEQEVTKKQKVGDVQETPEVDDDQEVDKIKELMEIVPDEEEVAIDAIPLANKPPTIVD